MVFIEAKNIQSSITNCYMLILTFVHTYTFKHSHWSIPFIRKSLGYNPVLVELHNRQYTFKRVQIEYSYCYTFTTVILFYCLESSDSCFLIIRAVFKLVGFRTLYINQHYKLIIIWGRMYVL